ncbi:RrF2 family transcriptional regulator [Aporhodopirellula aestuarii]|uniref:Rrf2 family transcriptional regulator n=1 Tax=Aporhodopirellula aestuarii TaxID=2950107 RepID=A0ABT0TYS7_9BACT|nr:Rrf2 family transcriptional regulator [Aporhodopirellula aestuarii]MCM2369685.1 Rrf2 family transcriptional regulator [Aporhodopirellula aestuarii]
MKLTTQTDYAMRTLMVLATRKERVHVADVANLFGISVNHVAKVVNLLARAGFVRSVRGVGGGIELAQGTNEISIGEVIALMDWPRSLARCSRRRQSHATGAGRPNDCCG